MRHGTTAWNVEHKLQGRTDIPLDDRGVLMAELTGQTLKEKGVRFDLVFSSPLIRALETARLIAPYAQASTDERLVELSFGQCEGKVTDIMLRSDDCPFRFFKKDPVKYNEEIRLADGESLDSLLERTSDFLREVIEPYAGTSKRILISGHGALNRGLLMHIRGTSDLSGFWGTGLQANCGMTKVDVSLSREETPVYKTTGESMIFYDESLMIDPSKDLV